MSIYVSKRKNDQYREGNTILLAKSGKSTCQVSVTVRLLKCLKGSSPKSPLLRCIVKSKSKEYFHASLGISSSRIREEFKSHIKPFVEDLEKFSMHSLKSGAASNPGCRLLDGSLIDRHAGWRCTSSKHRYVKYSDEDLLGVSKSLGL